jgi:hypothetical protein
MAYAIRSLIAEMSRTILMNFHHGQHANGTAGAKSSGD